MAIISPIDKKPDSAMGAQMSAPDSRADAPGVKASSGGALPQAVGSQAGIHGSLPDTSGSPADAKASTSGALPDIKALSSAELVLALAALGQPAYRGRQIQHWLYAPDAVTAADFCQPE